MRETQMSLAVVSSPLTTTQVTDIFIQGNWINQGSDEEILTAGSSGPLMILAGDLDGVVVGGINSGEGNIIRGGVSAALVLSFSALGDYPEDVSFLGNSIFEQTNEDDVETIDLVDDSDTNFEPDTDLGWNTNDAGDGDIGSNGYLNHPEIESVIDNGDGTATVEFALDVPADDYRIEFYDNDTSDRELQTFLDADTISHPGLGEETFTSTISAESLNYVVAIAVEVDDTHLWGYGDTSEISNIVVPETIEEEPEHSSGSRTGSSKHKVAFNVQPTPSPQVTTPTPTSFTLSLTKKGDSGIIVKILQVVLTLRGFNTGTPDGQFGPNTEQAVKEYQLSKGLDPDGIVGPATWAMFREK